MSHQFARHRGFLLLAGTCGAYLVIKQLGALIPSSRHSGSRAVPGLGIGMRASVDCNQEQFAPLDDYHVGTPSTEH